MVMLRFGLDAPPEKTSVNPILNQTAFYEVMGGEVVERANAVRRQRQRRMVKAGTEGQVERTRSVVLDGAVGIKQVGLATEGRGSGAILVDELTEDCF